MRAFEIMDKKKYQIQDDTYELKVFEGKRGMVLHLTKTDGNGNITTLEGRNFTGMLRAIITAYEVPSPADRAYSMEGHYFVIRLTEKDVIIDFKYAWRKHVSWIRFYNEDAALLWILRHFRVW